MEDDDIMPFGKFKGRAMQDVPAGYLLFLYDKMAGEGGPRSMGRLTKEEVAKVYDYMERNHKILQSEVKDYICQHKPHA